MATYLPAASGTAIRTSTHVEFPPAEAKLPPADNARINHENESLHETDAGFVPKRTMAVPEPDLKEAMAEIDNRVLELQEDVGCSSVASAIMSKLSGKKVGATEGLGREKDNGEITRGEGHGSGSCNEKNKTETPVVPGARVPSESALSDENRIERLRSYQADAAESLKVHLQRLVHPISVEDYRSLLDVYHAYDNVAGEAGGGIEDSMEDMSLGTFDSNLNDDDDDSDSNVEEDEDIEEEDLLDVDIHARAKTLRENVRVAAARVRELRDGQAQRVLRITEREIEKLNRSSADVLTGSNSRALDTYFSEEGEDDGGAFAHEPDLVKSDSSPPKIEAMRSSLDILVSSLQKVDSVLPEKIEGLQQTVSAVDVALRRRRGNEEKGGRQALSQIDRAIISRDNEGKRQDSKGALLEALEEEQEREREHAHGLGAGEKFALLMGGGLGGL
eukprot:CAMPEP_0197449320 /NCGR_PEP_ID=MMETSP1175-20131217/20973_1 /TAXON_ID=1003142 /ORGANISM="Triceratium dubium, Strain CCMP147" /LENGTH=446 /DNA_ID=CAMNT_0042981411 /DNA_START=70 /DNA_END=1410 /DNA_ORIENTATION=-